MFVALLASACADAPAARAPTIHRPGPAGRGYFATLTPREVALGDPRSQAARAPRAKAEEPLDLDLYLKPARVGPAREVERRRAARPRPTAHERAPAAPVVATLPPASKVPAPAAGDAQRYASRERQDSKQMQYRGGDVIVISVSTLLIALLIVLIVLLLT